MSLEDGSSGVFVSTEGPRSEDMQNLRHRERLMRQELQDVMSRSYHH